MISLTIRPSHRPGPDTGCMTEEEKTKLTLLQSTLQAAVPLWCQEIECWDDGKRADRRAACAQAVAEHGDVILYRGKKCGQTADAFNRLAEGLALSSLMPGGVHVFGLHFEATET